MLNDSISWLSKVTLIEALASVATLWSCFWNQIRFFFFGDDVAKIRSIEEQLKDMKTERSKQETVSDFFSPK